jgi:hypothetical protein
MALHEPFHLEWLTVPMINHTYFQLLQLFNTGIKRGRSVLTLKPRNGMLKTALQILCSSVFIEGV